MDAKKIMAIVAGVGGLAVLVAIFFIFRGETPDDIFGLNLIVSMIAYCLLLADVLTPYINLKDGAQRTVGSLSFRWSTTAMYLLSVLATMILCNYVFEVSFTIQLIIHCILLLLLLGGIITQLFVADHTAEVHHNEQMLLQGTELMKRAARRLQDTSSLNKAVPVDVKRRIENLCSSVRYISPSNNPEASRLEHQFVDTINDIVAALPQYEMNKERIIDNLAQAEVIYNNRKSVYSI